MMSLKNNDSSWTLIANGKQVANGETIRRNGVVSHFQSVPHEESKKNEEKSHFDVASPKEKNEFSIESKNNKESTGRSLKVNTFCIKSTNEALSTVIHQLKWKESKGNFKSGSFTADMYWHGAGFDEGLYNQPGIYAVNKLPGMIELSQKIHLSRIIKRMQSLFPGEFDFYPPTWFLPEQYHQFVAEVTTKSKPKSDVSTTAAPGVAPTMQGSFPESRKKKKTCPTYIVKPDCGSQGDGIYLVNNPRDVQDAIGCKPAVVQTYIDDPLLLDNFKFDLRMYVAIARINPIEIYLCKDGLVRLCTVEYESPRSSNLKNTFMHLTNYSLNKFSEDFLLTSAEHTGSKRTYRGIRHILQKRGIDVDKIHQQIVDLVVKTVLSLIPDITVWDHVTNRSRRIRTFQILGFDILLTSDLKAHLLEVNSSPSMDIDVEVENPPGSGVYESVTSTVDEQIKVPLLRDVLRLIAYGESKLDMNKSCLQRVYPPTPTTSSSNHSTPRQMLKSTGKLNAPYLRHSISKPPENFRTVKALDIEGKENEEFSFNLESARSTNSRETFQNKDLGVNSKRQFDNPLLHADVTPRQKYPAKRPKKFTVVKYKQECAISTEEWRLFQQRSKLPAQLLERKTLPTPGFNPNSTPRKPPKSPVPSKPTKVDPFLLREADWMCANCGHYLDGVGPGLFQAQRQYNETNGHANGDKDLPQDNVQKRLQLTPSVVNSLPEISSKRLPPDWESEVRVGHVTPLVPRSIYFDVAQRDQERLFTSRGRPTPDPQVDEEAESRRKTICDRCLEESSNSSSSDDSTYKYVRRSISYQSPRNRNCFDSNPDPVRKRREQFAVQDLLLVKRAASVFIFFNGCKPSLRISATSFRNMVRRCHLSESGAMPAIDILFIDIMRQWQRQEHSSPYYDAYRSKSLTIAYHSQGLPFQGFLEAIFRIAKAKIKGGTLKERLETLVISCERYIKEANRASEKIAKKSKDTKQAKYSQTPSPRISCGLSIRQPYF